MENTIVKKQNQNNVPAYSPLSLLQLAIESKADIAQLEKLMALHETWEKGQAKKKYLSAIVHFQNSCPVITKSKTVAFGNTRYNYAPLGEIAAQIKSALHDSGLSYRWELKDEAENIACTCIVSHIDGHSEQTTMSAKKDSSGGKNEIQQRGSSVTYLQRYSLLSAFGISTADEDVDGRQPNQTEAAKETKTEPIEQSEFLLELSALVDAKRELLTIPELKRAREIIKNKEVNSYVKLRTILKNK